MKSCVPVHTAPALIVLIAVVTYPVDAAIVELTVATAVGTEIVAPVKLCVPVHVL